MLMHGAMDPVATSTTRWRGVYFALAILAGLHARTADAQIAALQADSLLAKGKGEFVSVNYHGAAEDAQQVVATLGITNDQRIRALQLWIAAVFPDDRDPSTQHRDSALALIKRLAALTKDRTIKDPDLAWSELGKLIDIGGQQYDVEHRPARVLIGVRIPNASVYVDNGLPTLIDTLRNITVPASVDAADSTRIRIHADGCARDWDTTLTRIAADTALSLGIRNPWQCSGFSPLLPEQPSNNALDVLLRAAFASANGLAYHRADSIAHLVASNSVATPTQVQREQAYTIIAVANYPEARGYQHRDAAVAALEEIVKLNLDAALPQEVRWAGLDSVLDDAKKVAFGIAVTADSKQDVIGPTGTASLQVRSNHPATFKLTLTPLAGGEAIESDSIGPVTTGALHFKAMRDGQPLLATGDYMVTIVAHAAQTSDSSVVHHVARVEAPKLDLETIPAAVDSSKLLPERSGKFGWRGIVLGVFVAGSSYALGTYAKASFPATAQVQSDSKGTAVGLGLATAIIAASYLDPGRLIKRNISANQTLQDDLKKSIETARSDNALRVGAYKATVTIDPEAK